MKLSYLMHGFFLTNHPMFLILKFEVDRCYEHVSSHQFQHLYSFLLASSFLFNNEYNFIRSTHDGKKTM